MNKVSPLNFTFSRVRWLFSILIFFVGVLVLIFGIFFQEKQTNDIVFLIDNSLSMSALDIEWVGAIRISRLDVAKQYIQKVIEKNSAFHFSLVSFSLVPQVLSPLSDDRDTTLLILHSLETVPYGQPTNIRESLSLFQKLYGNFRGKVIILSDGENTSSSSLSTLSPLSDGVFIGIGTPTGAKITQGYDGDGKARYKEYDGKPVVSILDTDSINKLAGELDIDTAFIKKLSDIESISTIFPIKDSNSMRSILGIFLICMLLSLYASPYTLLKK